MATDTSGDTPLHIAASCGHQQTVRDLLTSHKYEVNCTNTKYRTPLHLACFKGHIDTVRTLLLEFGADVNSKDSQNNTPLMQAALGGHTDVVCALITEFGCSPQVRGFEGRTPLHCACEKGHSPLIEVLLSKFGLSLLSTDKDGNTPLHIASMFSQPSAVEKLLFEHDAPLFVRNNAGKSPVDVAKGNEVTSLFKRYRREKSSRIQSEYEQLQSIAKKKFSGKHALTRIFVVGYPQAGKSSLIEALKREGLFYSIFTRTSRLSEADVPPYTAGIVPSVYTSSQYGRVVFYDFAGDPEYYSSHAAVLESLVSPGCNLFLAVVDLSEEKEVMTQKLGYWLSFISFHSKSSCVSSEVVVIGSHVDVIESLGLDPRDKLHHLEMIATKFCKQKHYMKLNPGLSLDCCRPTTSSMSNLRSMLKKTYTANPTYVLSLGATILLGLLERDFSSVTACQVSTIFDRVQQVGMRYLISMQQLYPVLKELHNLGLLIVVGSASDARDHWLLLNVSALTEEVHKKLFAKDSLMSQSLADSPLSTLGIIPESVLTRILPEYITKECLKQLQYCQELKHIEIGSHHSIVPVASSSVGEPLLFFPALLQNERDAASLAIPQGQHICSRGWYIKCTGEFDYFPPRFLHVLLLRLAFRFALRPFEPSFPSEQSGEQLSVNLESSPAVAADIHRCSRRCNMWKSGICWLMEEGVECVVEVVKESRGVVVVARSEEDSDVECASVFAAVVQKVMEAKTEFCHSITTETFLIDPDELNQSSLPSVTELHLYAMCEVERVLVERVNRVRSVCRKRFLDLKKLSYMKCCTYWNLLFPMELTKVLRTLEPVVGNWKMLGLELGLSCNVLDTIESDCHTIFERKMRMVQRWMSALQLCPSWCFLVKALPKVGLNTAAERISKEYNVPLQEKLLDPENTATAVDDKFLREFAEVVGDRWPSLASLLSFPTADVEQMKREVVGTPAEQALHMLRAWRRRSREATYGGLCARLKSISLFGTSSNITEGAQQPAVVDPPWIVQNPETKSVATGTDVTFTVEATGDDLHYQWQKDGNDIDSSESRFSSIQTESTSTLRIECVKKSDKGHYNCLVKNPVGMTSSAAELTVYDDYLSVYEQVVQEHGKIDQTIMHCIFVGPPGVGKSSLLKRLIRRELDKIRTSTQVVEKSVQVEVRDVVTHVAEVNVSGLDWQVIEDPTTQAHRLIGQLPEKTTTTTSQDLKGQHSKQKNQRSGKDSSPNLPVEKPSDTQTTDSCAWETSDSQITNPPGDGTQIINPPTPETNDTQITNPPTQVTNDNKPSNPPTQEANDNQTSNPTAQEANDSQTSNSETSRPPPQEVNNSQTSNLPAQEANDSQISNSPAKKSHMINLLAQKPNGSPPSNSDPRLKEFLRDVLKKKGVPERCIDKWTLYLTDSGGQPEFQELLPALVVGPCVFFVVFPLHKDLNEPYPVQYMTPNKCTKEYVSSLTIKEDIMRSLASIASTQYANENEEPKEKERVQVLLVATFKDEIPEKEERKRRLKQLADLVRETDAFRHGMIVSPSKTKMVFTIDNKSDEKAKKGAKKIRDAFGAIAKKFKVSTPSTWLIFGILVQHVYAEHKVIGKEQCFKLAQECGIQHEEFEAALEFLCKQTGMVHYYKEPSELSTIVIRDPQHLFTRVNELVERTFDFQQTYNLQCTEDFENKGIFSVTDYESLTEEHSSSKLTPSMLLKLLEQLKVVVPLGNREKYFMPCAITHLTEASSSNSRCSAIIPPLLIRFESGYCPKGLFGVLVACIVNKPVAGYKLRLDKTDTCITRDAICFGIGQNELLLKITPTYIYIELKTKDTSFLAKRSSLCNDIRKCIEYYIERACETLHYSCSTKYRLSFPCQCSQEEKFHPAELSKGHIFHCTQSGEKSDMLVNQQCHVWLPEPTIIRDLKSQFVASKANVEFVVEATGLNLQFQWQKFGKNLDPQPRFYIDNSQANSSTLCIQPVTKSDKGRYKCLVSNPKNSKKSSSAAELKVFDPPDISEHPNDQSVATRADITFKIEASGDSLEFQWQKNGVDIGTNEYRLCSSKPNTSTLQILCVKKSDQGHYRCLVKNPIEQSGKSSYDAKLAIFDPPDISEHPNDQSVDTGGDITFKIEASGDSLEFQWQKNGVAIGTNESRLCSSKPNTSTLQILCVKKSDQGHYRCLVKNPIEQSGKSSNDAKLAIFDPPDISEHPNDQSVATGADITFKIEASGDSLEFQWQKNGVDIGTNEYRLCSSKPNTSTLQILCVKKSDQGHYRCLVKNPIEQSGKSSYDAKLAIFDPPDISEHPNDQSVDTGGDITFKIEASGDSLEFQWQKNGVDIGTNESRFCSSKSNTSTLQILCVEKSDQGHYRCLVKNPVEQSGKSSYDAKLAICLELSVRNIMNVLHEAGFSFGHWEQLGQQLIEYGTLATFRANRGGDSHLCMSDTIFQWLNNDLDNSWEKLAGAVAKVEKYGHATANCVLRKAGIILQCTAVTPKKQRASPQSPPTVDKHRAVVMHKEKSLHPQAPSTPVSNTVDILGEENLIEITDYLFELKETHIYHLGLVLGLSHPRVKEMESSKTFLDDMIAAWLKKVDQVGVPTWQRLVEALKHRRVGQTGIASEIEKDKLHNP